MELVRDGMTGFGHSPLLLGVDGEVSLDDGGPLQPTDGEGEGPRLVGRHDLAVAHRELVERVAVVAPLGLRLEAHQVAVVEQHEVAVAPVADVLAALVQPALLDDAGLRLLAAAAAAAALRHAARGAVLPVRSRPPP